MPRTKRKNSNRNHKTLRYDDLVSTRSGTLAGKFMRRFWHPIHRAEELRAGASQTDSDHERALYALPWEQWDAARRGFSLPAPRHAAFRRAGSKATRSAACITAGASTRRVSVRSSRPKKNLSPERSASRSYPTREYLGLIFAYFGEGDAPAFPRYRHMEEDGVLEVLSTEVWPCNFFQRIDNNGDTYHVPFVHRGAYSASSDNNRSGLPDISKEESPWGTTGYASFAQGWRNVFQFFMPNVYAFRNPSPEPECSRKTACSGTFRSTTKMLSEFRLRRLPLSGEAARAYRARQDASAAEPKLSVAQMGEAVLSGKLSFQDLDNFFKDKISLVHAQDYVAQVGQGSLADRAREHLGRSDVGVILFRRIWERELRALAEGRPLKKWVLPQDAEIKFQEEPEKLVQNARR